MSSLRWIYDETVTDNDLRSIDDINKHCLQEFRSHWQCLENYNHQLWNCRSAERKLNKCVFDNLVRSTLQTRNPHEQVMLICIYRSWRRRYQVRQRARPRYICGRQTPLPGMHEGLYFIIMDGEYELPLVNSNRFTCSIFSRGVLIALGTRRPLRFPGFTSPST